MKSFFITISVSVLSTLLFLSNTVFAGAPGGGIENPIGVKSIEDLITHLLTIMIDIAVIVSVLFFIFAGLKMVMARGDPEEIKNAKGMIWYTAVGASIAVGAKSIQLLIQNTVAEFDKPL